jgi:hypothetical protein
LTDAIPDIEQLWRERMRCARTKPSTSAEQKQVDDLGKICAEYGAEPALKTIEDVTRGGWQGIFPDRHVKAATRREDSDWGGFAGVKREMDGRLS